MTHIREPRVAGQFYPAEPSACRRQAEALMCSAGDDVSSSGSAAHSIEPARRIGGLVPHAGWSCSGRVAACVFAALREAPAPRALILFGGVHRYRGVDAALFARGVWKTPLGTARVDEPLCGELLTACSGLRETPEAHLEEHSLEVQIPFLTLLLAGVPIVPIMVPITPAAPDLGRAVAETIRRLGVRALIIGTTDLTHYGPDYGFAPQGEGPRALAWAKANDRGFIERTCSMRADELLTEAAKRRNACNAGAAAATVACCATLGANRGVLLQHTTSREVLGMASANSVGYAGILFVS